LNTSSLLLAVIEMLDFSIRPTIYFYRSNFEPWVRRHGLEPGLERLRRARMVRWETEGLSGNIPRLSRRARQRQGGLVDPTLAWSRDWDGSWHTVNFDLPETQRAARKRLRQLLRGEGFGCVQRSFWIAPDVHPKLMRKLEALSAEVGTLTLLLSRPVHEETHRSLVRRGWDFETLGNRYRDHRALLSAVPDGTCASWGEISEWLKDELCAWRRICELDPFLPEPLLPPGYLGQEVWAARTQAFAQLIR